jgi:predicted amidohydrolase YtcJ
VRAAVPAPDLVFHNGAVVTLDRGSRVARAVAVRDGRVTAVGDDPEILRACGRETRRVDLAGRAVLPGFFDAHPHADREGLRARGGRSPAGLGSVAAIVEAVREAARATPPGEWIVPILEYTLFACLPRLTQAIEPGKVADLVVLAENPLTCDLDRLRDLRVDETLVDGRTVYARAG